jgi:lysophospholipase L1-like esterase
MQSTRTRMKSDRVGARFMVLGDSLAEGRGDPQPDGGYAGWAHQLAHRLGLTGDELINLGTFRATTAAIADDQLPRLAEHKCEFVAVACGTNDVFDGEDLEVSAATMDMVISAAVASGATTLTCTLPEVSRRLPLPESTQRRLGERFSRLNEVIRVTSKTYGARCLDLWRLSDLTDRSLWHADRIHPSPAGHALIAARFAELLPC